MAALMAIPVLGEWPSRNAWTAILIISEVDPENETVG